MKLIEKTINILELVYIIRKLTTKQHKHFFVGNFHAGFILLVGEAKLLSAQEFDVAKQRLLGQ